MNITAQRINISHRNWCDGRCFCSEYNVDIFKQGGEFFALRIYRSVERGRGNFHLGDGWRFPATKEEEARGKLADILGMNNERLSIFSDKRDSDGRRVVRRRTPYCEDGVPTSSLTIEASYHEAKSTDMKNATFL